jgi:hypothetical protein
VHVHAPPPQFPPPLELSIPIMVLARLRSLFRSWQEVRDLTRQSPERLQALIKQNEAKAAASEQRLASMQQSMAVPFEQVDAASAHIALKGKVRAAELAERAAVQLEGMNIDVYALQQKVRQSCGGGGRGGDSSRRYGSRAVAAGVGDGYGSVER